MNQKITTERAFLRAILKQPDVIDKLTFVRPDDFMGDVERECFAAMRALHRLRLPITEANLSGYLGPQGPELLHQVSKLTGCGNLPEDRDTLRLAENVVNEGARRALIPILSAAIEALRRDDELAEAVFDSLSDRAWRILCDGRRRRPMPIDDCLYGALHLIDQVHTRALSRTGWNSLDRLLRWWPSRSVTLFTAERPVDLLGFA